MSSENGASPPRIERVADGTLRPQWSVMIPTYNCAKYLRQTLESVLAQDLGPEQMQIEVVDDCSTKDDPGAVVREVGGGRVDFHRRATNGGAIANFNTCLTRSRGHLVHVLHGDDYVLPGFFAAIGELAERNPDVSLLATRSFVVDEESVIAQVTPRVRMLEAAGRNVECFYRGTPLQCAGVVMRRTFYEKHGGFQPTLVHAADWEMWSRAVGFEGGVLTEKVLACYRDFGENDTSRLRRTAENLRDCDRLFRIFADRYPTFDYDNALTDLRDRALWQANGFAKSGDRTAFESNMRFWRERTPRLERLRASFRNVLRRIEERLGLLLRT